METRSAFVAIVGCPNVGKSSLLNEMLGQKIAIVSNKPQTTRTKIMGVLTQNETQLVFTDTPGLHRAKNKLSAHMVKAVKDSVADVDIILFVVEPKGKIRAEEIELIENFQKLSIPVVLVINKIDTILEKQQIMGRIQEFSGLYPFTAVIPVSALTADGIDFVIEELSNLAEPGIHFFADDTLTDQPERVLVSEMIREKILLLFRQEIPHGIAVSIESMKERKKGDIMDIEATIFCEKSSHKGMLIGKNGSMLKTIGSQAREDIERFFDIKVNLQLWVKVREDWRNKENIIKSFGLS